MTNIDNYGLPADRFVGRIADHEDRIAVLERLLSERGDVGERRNMVDNAAAQIAQRGSVANLTAMTGGYYTADRWALTNQVTATTPTLEFAVTDVLTPDGLDQAMRVTCGANAKPALGANDYIILYHGIEGLTLRAVQALSSYYDLDSTTISFWVYPTFAATFTTELLLFNQAGAALQQISRSYTVLANLWQKITFNIPKLHTGTAIAANQIQSTTGTAAVLYFWLAAGSSYTGGASLNTNWTLTPATNTRAVGQSNLVSSNGQALHLTNVQWEVGDAPTKFERLNYATDLLRCQRYFQRHVQPPLRGVVGSGTSMGRLGMVLPVRMRVKPTVSMNGNLPIYDGQFTSTLASVGANLCALSDAIEFDATASSAPGFVQGRAAVVYQNGTGSSLDVSADL